MPEERAGEQDGEELPCVHYSRKEQRAICANRVHDEQLACVHVTACTQLAALRVLLQVWVIPLLRCVVQVFMQAFKSSCRRAIGQDVLVGTFNIVAW